MYTSLNPVPNAQVCVYLTVHITKLQLQTTFSKSLCIPHSACIHWDLKILMFALLVTREIATYNHPPPLARHAFPRQRRMRRGGGGGYLFLPGSRGWMTGPPPRTEKRKNFSLSPSPPKPQKGKNWPH